MKLAELSRGVELGGKFRLIDIIGQGSYGTVWKADVVSDCGLPAQIALKVYHDQESATRKLMSEALQATQFQHDRLVKVYGAERIDGLVVMWMEYVPGHNLLHYLGEDEQPKPLSLDTIMHWLHDMAEGLAYLHVQDPPCVHGDLKLDNVLVDQSLGARLTDFGQSRTIEDRFVSTVGVGGLPYLAPEVIGVHNDGRGQRFVSSDIYAFGVIAYRILTGRFPRSTAPEIFNQVPFPRPHDLNHTVPVALDGLVMTCLEKRESDRYPTGAALLASIEQIADQLKAKAAEPVDVPAPLPQPGAHLVEEMANMARDLLKEGKEEEVIDRLDRAMTRMSTAPRVLLLYAEAAKRLGKLEVAEAMYRRVLHWFRTNGRPECEWVDAQEGLAEVLIRRKQYERAVAGFVWLVEYAPLKRWYRYRLGVAYGLAGRFERSIDVLQQLYDEEQDALVCAKIGFAYYQKKDVEQACLYFNEALMLDSYEPTALCCLGEIRAIQGNVRKAKQYLLRLHEIEGAEDQERRLSRLLGEDMTVAP